MVAGRIRNACGHVYPKVNPVLPSSLDQRHAGTRHGHREGMPKRGLRKRQFHAAKLRERPHCQICHLMSTRARRLHTLFAPPQDGRCGQGGDKALIGTNIGRRFFTPNVLFTRRQHEKFRGTAFAIKPRPYKTPWGAADILFVGAVEANAKNAQAGAAKMGSDGERLALANQEIGPLSLMAKAARRLQSSRGQQHGVNHHDRLGTMRVRQVGQSVHVFQASQTTGLRKHNPSELSSTRPSLFL